MNSMIRCRARPWALMLLLVCACGRGNLRHVPMAAPAAPSGPLLNVAQQASLTATVEAAWPQRDDPQVLTTLIADLETLVAQTPPTDAIHGRHLARLSHAYFLQARAQRLLHDRKSMQDSLARGVLTGERALIALYPAMDDSTATPDPISAHLPLVETGGMEALTWYVSNLGAYAASRGMTSLMFYRDRVTAILERMLMVDADFLYSTPHRYWAILLARAPAFAGGNLEQARIHFEHAMQAAPGYFANACDYAQFYALPKGDRKLFERLLTDVVQGDSASLQDVAPEMRLEQQRAKSLLERVETLF